MMTKIHLISGLPRSGSTLLGAILAQNPRFEAGMSSPIANLCSTLMQKMSGTGEFGAFFSDERRLRVLRGLFESYYDEAERRPVIFDTNRGWTAIMPAVEKMFLDTKVICCVREVSWILDSVERISMQSALQTSKLFNNKTGGTIYSRAEQLMNHESGLIGHAWSAFREAWFGPFASRLIVINYESLVRAPSKVIDRLYSLIGEPPFHHDFYNVHYEAVAFDADLGVKGMHTVRPEVAFEERQTCLPPDLFRKFSGINFWLDPKLNPRGVTIVDDK